MTLITCLALTTYIQTNLKPKHNKHIVRPMNMDGNRYKQWTFIINRPCSLRNLPPKDLIKNWSFVKVLVIFIIQPSAILKRKWGEYNCQCSRCSYKSLGYKEHNNKLWKSNKALALNASQTDRQTICTMCKTILYSSSCIPLLIVVV